jgi:hypothetical protein
MELQISELFLIGTAIATVTGSFFAVKFGSKETKNAFIAIKESINELRADSKKFLEQLNVNTKDVALIQRDIAVIQKDIALLQKELALVQKDIIVIQRHDDRKQ